MNRRCLAVMFAASLLPLASFAADPVKDAVSADAVKREAALKTVQASFAEHLRPYLSENSPDSSEKLRAILEDQISVTHWSRDVIKLDEKKRAAQIEWGLKPENFKLIADAYSNSNTRKSNGLKALGKVEGSGADFIIARFIPERTAQIHTAAMDAAWERKPSEEVVDALWSAALTSRPAALATGGMSRRAAVAAPQQLLAVDTLVHLKAPQLGPKIDAYLEKPTGTLPAAEVDRLILASPTYASLTYYAKRFSDKSLDTRVRTLEQLIAATGQKEDEYKLSVISDEKVAAAVEQFNKWLTDHKADKFPGVPAPAATRPAERNAARAATAPAE